jgi:glycerol-3-phosphate dehydrogenase
MAELFDVAIIGGGINGCGCAADAALRGLSLVLLEQDDLASQTSSSSTKLIHGGLRYLEQYEFSLVKKALEERQNLLNLAPHLVHAQSFILPYQKHMRPSWFLRLGLFLYDHLSTKNRLPRCSSVYRKESTYFDPLVKELNQGFLFYDGATDDARLTIMNALQAKNHGASIRPYERVIKTEAVNNIWQISIQPKNGQPYQVQAKTLINATGPWVEATAKLTQNALQHQLALVKGSHIVVPKLYEGKQAYFLQHKDKRVVFVIPYNGYSMIGTTDVPFNTESDKIETSTAEIQYLTTLVNSYFKKQIQAEDIIYAWAGVRPLLAAKNKEASALSRDYSYEVTLTPAPIITILGGKITTYRQLAEEVINQLSLVYPEINPSLTKIMPLPGATLNSMDFTQYCLYAREKYHWLNADLLDRYLHSYGSTMEAFLAPCTDLHSMGKRYGTELYQVELNYLIENEWAQNLDDVLMRRTKLGLSMDEETKKELREHLSSRFPQRYQAELGCH